MLRNRIRLMLSHPSILILFCLWIVGWIAISQNFQWNTVAFIFVGIVFQFFNEYSIHRHIFHHKPPKNQFWFNLLYQLHYGHHDVPEQSNLFFVPVWFAVPMAGINFLLAWVVIALLGFANPVTLASSMVLVGGIGVFLCYEWFHMTAHTSGPKTAIETYVSKLHGRHHFQDPNALFHVSPGGIVIDRIMGTAFDPEARQRDGRMAFIKTLGLDPQDPRLVAARKKFVIQPPLPLTNSSNEIF